MTVPIAYLVHDVADAAVHRRMRMLQMGGAQIRLAGFRRGAQPSGDWAQGLVVNLGQTADAKFAGRMASVAKAMVNLSALEPVIRGADVVLARNLEMLAIARRARDRFAPHATLVYECLDIHRLLLSPALPGRLIRSVEARLWQDIDLLLTSSPAFISNHFAKCGYSGPVELLENKVLEDAAEPPRAAGAPAVSVPWKIGFFGMLRCRRSVDILASLAKALDGKVEVILRGKPSPAVFPDFPALIATMPHVSFHGPYQGAAALPNIYGEVHFAWAVDYFEASQNSDWLLPNRMYESSYFGAVPIALSHVETGRWLARQGAGVLLPDPPDNALLAFFSGLNAARVAELQQQLAEIPRHALACTAQDCRRLVARLRERVGYAPAHASAAGLSR